MAPISRTPSSSNCATRRLCGPAKAKSTFLAIPSSKRVRCSGLLILEIIRWRSCSFFGSAFTRDRERKSACFWLSPSRTIRSPGAIRDSNACTRCFCGNTGPFIQEETNCIRLFFSSRRVVHDRVACCRCLYSIYSPPGLALHLHISTAFVFSVCIQSVIQNELWPSSLCPHDSVGDNEIPRRRE